MIVYFADRGMRILGHASTTLRQGNVITDDNRVEDIETGVSTFNCEVSFTDTSRAEVERMTNAGNYILRYSSDRQNEFYTIIDAEIDTKAKLVRIYAEDAGLDLINEVVGDFEATEAHPATWYVNKYIADSGFEIGINEIPKSTQLTLKWEGEATVTERLASIATQFGGYDISFTVDVKGLEVTHKYVNFFKQRGADEGIQLRLNKEVDRIITTKSVANLATAFLCEGGVPDDSDKPITLKGHSYDDGDFYVDGLYLKSRKAVEKWSRYVWDTKLNRLSAGDGHIVVPYSYNTTSQQELRNRAITELKKRCDMEINYEIDINRLPKGVKIGDRVNIIDDAGELYISTRILMLETSETGNKQTATLGEHIIKKGGISQKVEDLAAEFAKNTVSVQRALSIASAANEKALEAKEQAEAAAAEVAIAEEAATTAQAAAAVAEASATTAEAKALAAEAAVDKVESSVQSIEKTVENAEKAVKQAEEAAGIAETKAAEAEKAAENAANNAAEANTAAGKAQTASESAVSKADEAHTLADAANTQAQAASDTAAAAKLDAEQAEKDIAEFSKSLETLSQTMTADYARKTDLTETTAQLQSQISVNAGQIATNVSQLTVIDETANDAKEKADAATTTANAAKTTADQATADAQAAQNEADKAAAAAATAQSEADKAAAAAVVAQGVADKAEADLEAAKADLATVQGRVDATEDEIAAAQLAVDEAQAAADQAKSDAEAAAAEAATAQSTASTAAATAVEAQTKADEAATTAATAQSTAASAAGAASNANTTANQAVATANTAQATANAASDEATAAQNKANEAATTAAAAQDKAEEADGKAQQAQADLTIAQANLDDVKGRVDATEDDIAAAEEAVIIAQNKAKEADEAAALANQAAVAAQNDAKKAQDDADKANTAAGNAQKAADEAKGAAAQAQTDVNNLAVRVSNAETNIIQTNEKIELKASKTDLELLEVGGRNRLLNSADAIGWNLSQFDTYKTFNEEQREIQLTCFGTSSFSSVQTVKLINLVPKQQYTCAFKLKQDDTLNIDSVNIRFIRENSVIKEWTIPGTDIPTSYKKFVNTFEASNAYTWEDMAIRITLYRGTEEVDTKLYIKEAKLEEGSKATGWTPAPEDIDSEFHNHYTKEETDAAIEVASESITLSVKEVVSEGGRNYATKTSDEWEQLTTFSDSYNVQYNRGLIKFSTAANENAAKHSFSEFGIEPGDFLTVSVDIKNIPNEGTIGNPMALTARLGYKNSGASTELHRAIGTDPVPVGETGRSVFTIDTNMTIPEGYEGYIELWVGYSGSDANFTGGSPVFIRRLKIERGQHHTDWTRAPEDIDSDIASESERLQGIISEKESTILTNAEGITLEHLASYTKKDDYDRFKQDTETALNLEEGAIGMKFKETEEQIQSSNGELADVKTTLEKYFTFTGNGLIISAGNNQMTLEIDNDIISFKKNGEQFGWWDGSDFHTGSIYVDVEKRAQFGNFAFLPRSDGSLMFLKVGET